MTNDQSPNDGLAITNVRADSDAFRRAIHLRQPDSNRNAQPGLVQQQSYDVGTARLWRTHRSRTCSQREAAGLGRESQPSHPRGALDLGADFYTFHTRIL